MKEPSKPVHLQVFYLFAILCGVLGAVFFLYTMSARHADAPISISSPAPVSQNGETPNAGETSRWPAESSLQDLLNSYDPSGQLQPQPPDPLSRGVLNIMGGRIKCGTQETEKCDANDRALKVLRSVGVALKIDEKNLRRTRVRSAWNVYQLDEYFDAYPVFGASIKGLTSGNDAEIYHIQSSLREIHQVNFNRTISESQARKIFSEKFQIGEESKITIKDDTLWVYGRSPTENILVWWMQFEQRVPVLRSVDAFIDAGTGQVFSRSNP